MSSRGSKIWSNLILAAVVVAALAALGWVTWRHVVPDVKADDATDSRDATSTIAAAKAAVVAGKPDATSVTFGKIIVHWQGDAPAICGLVTIDEPPETSPSEQRFIYLASTLLLEEDDGSAKLTQQWTDICED